MKNILAHGISGKKNMLGKLGNLQKYNFCSALKQNISNIENEILKSVNKFGKTYNLKIKPTIAVENEETVTFSDLKTKYYDNPSNSEIDQIIKILFKEEVLNIKKEKEYDKLILFITNCKKYKYDEYLTDIKYFKNKEIRNHILNTSLLENLSQKNSAFSVSSDFNARFKVQQLYNLRKGEKGEKIDRITEKQFENQKYSYMNYFAETSQAEKIIKHREISEKNSKVFSDFSKSNRLLETEEDVEINQEAWGNHYIHYMKKLKEQERKESLGASRHEEPYFEQAIKEKAEKATNSSEFYSNNAEQEQSTGSSDTFNRYYQSRAKTMHDGTNEPFPYFGLDDYPIEDYLDITKTAPNSELVYHSPRRLGDMSILQPNVEFFFDDIVKENNKWYNFILPHNTRLLVKEVEATLNNIFKESEMQMKLKKQSGEAMDGIELPQSLLAYYNLLPKWARDHPAIKMLVRGLDKNHPWVSFRSKMLMVNISLRFIMDFDENNKWITDLVYNTRVENITLQNLPSLMEHDEGDDRFVLQHPDDEVTDEDDYDFIQTAEDVRKIEKEEEEERKLKKKEEGRAKRAAEEVKQAASEGKIDKAAEEKKKKEEAEKKKKEEAAAAEAEEEPKEEEEVEETKKEDDTGKYEKTFMMRQNKKDVEEKGEAIMDIYDKLYGKMNEDSGEKLEDSDDDDSKMMKFNQDEDNDAQGSDQINEGGRDIEELRIKLKENKATMATKKIKINDIAMDLRQSEDLAIFEQKVLNLKSSLEDNNIRYIQLMRNEQLKGSLVNLEDRYASDLFIYPFTLMATKKLSKEQKSIIERLFSEHINSVEESKKPEIGLDIDEDAAKRTIEDAENEVLSRILQSESYISDKPEGLDIQIDYKESLKEEDIQVDDEELIGLNDAYYKPIPNIDIALRKEDPIPLDYYINDDGFWDDYIQYNKNRVDVKQINKKPFITIKDALKKKHLK
jgi:hypothetical protein